MKRLFYGWWIVAACAVILLMTVGVPFYGMPFFYDYFQRDFGWSRDLVTSGIGIATVLALPLGGFIIPRFSPRRLLIAGILLLSSSLVGFASMRGSLVVYFVLWILFMLGYLFAGPIPSQILISRWFAKRRGAAMAVAYLGLGIGGAISQKYVAMPLIRTIGWRGALFAMGSGLLLQLPLILTIVRNSPEECGLLPYGGKEPLKPEATGLHDLLRAAPFWFLAFGSFASIGSIGSVNQHMKLLFLDAGLTAEITADTTFIMLISSLLGRLVMGWLADRLPKKHVMIAAYLLIALPLPLLFVAGRPGMPQLFGGLFGFGLGADYMLIPLMAADLFGTHSLARVMGILLPADSIAQTVCPLIAGALYARAGSYEPVLLFMIVLAVSGALAVCFLPARSPQWVH
jgi:MFS family permease